MRKYRDIQKSNKKPLSVNYIIFDVEATCWQGNSNRQQEIIEIGAIKINGYGEVDSIFGIFQKN